MKNRVILCLMAVMLFSLALCLGGCDNNEKLQAPQNLRQEGRTIVWDAVDSALEYTVFVGNEAYTTNECYFNLYFLPSGKSKVEVMAVGESREKDSLRAEITYEIKELVKNGHDELGFYYELLDDELGYGVSAGKANLNGVVTIPDYFNDLPVKSISKYGFCSRKEVNYINETNCNMETTKLILPKHLQKIDQNSCMAMVRLEEVVIPDGVTTICKSAFKGCTHLKKVTLSKNLIKIDGEAFLDTALQELIIPEGVEYIGSSAFYCYDLTSGKITSDLSSIVIPSSVKHIGIQAFCGRENLSNIVMPENLDGLDFSWGVFENTAWYNSQPEGFVMLGDILYSYKGTLPENSSLTIPSGVKYIAGGAFSMQENLIKVVIPDGVKSIGNKAFNFCSKLEQVILPSNLEAIYDYAFNGCDALETVILPKSLKRFGSQPFGEYTNVFYEGSLERWNALLSQEHSILNFYRGTYYVYSAEKPKFKSNFWHYVDDKIVIWE